MVLSLRSLNLPPKCLEAAHRAYTPILYFLFFFAWIWYRGIPLADSIQLTIVIAIQISTGASIWERTSWRSNPSFPERLGMGLAIGTAVATTFDQILWHTILQPFAWLLPTLFIVLLSWMKPLSTRIARASSNDIPWLYISIAALILGFGTIRYGYGLMIVVLIIGYLISQKRTVISQSITYGFSLIFGFGILVLMRPSVEYGTWRLRPLYTGTDDLVFSESLSNSLSQYGLSEYSAAAGTHLRYHWFSLAWSGLTSRVAGSTPFDVTLHVVPVLAFLGIVALVWTLVFRLTKSLNVSNFSILVLFCANSLPDDIKFYFVLNTSNTISHIWILAAIVNFLLAIETMQKRWVFWFALFLAFSLLAKMPYGIVLLAATLGALIYATIRFPPVRVYALTMLFVSILISLATYLIFLTPNPWERRSFSVSFNPFNFGELTIYSLSITFLLVIAIAISRFPLSTIVFKESHSTSVHIFMVFISIGSLAGLASFIFDGGSAEKYFLNVALIFGSLLTAYSLFLLTKNLERKQLRNLFTIYTLALFLTFLFFGVLNVLSDFIDVPLGSNFQILIAPFIAVLLITAFSFVRNFRSEMHNLTSSLLFLIVMIGVSSGSFFLQALVKEPYNFTESVASTADLKSLDWVRSNVEEEEILATNRFLCNQEIPCSFDDSSFLISAVSRRRVLIEGPRFVIGGMPYPNWAKERIQKSIDFANSPSEKSWSQLKLFEVGWFYLDTNFVTPGLEISNNTWGPWATVAYHNSNVYILKLKN